MRYILSGEPKEVKKVVQENRIRVERGVISFTPVQPEGSTGLDDDTKDVIGKEDTKDAPEPTPKKTRSKKSE